MSYEYIWAVDKDPAILGNVRLNDLDAYEFPYPVINPERGNIVNPEDLKKIEFSPNAVVIRVPISRYGEDTYGIYINGPVSEYDVLKSIYNFYRTPVIEFGDSDLEEKFLQIPSGSFFLREEAANGRLRLNKSIGYFMTDLKFFEYIMHDEGRVYDLHLGS